MDRVRVLRRHDSYTKIEPVSFQYRIESDISPSKRSRSRFSRFTPQVSLLALPFLLAFLITFALSSNPKRLRSLFASSSHLSGYSSQCSPAQWSQGQWVRKSEPVFVVWGQAESRVPDFDGSGCGGDDDSEWMWQPAEGCYMGAFDKEELVKDLVERGGWLLIGDSMTATQIFSLSCMLSPHVVKSSRALEGSIDLSLPQELFLNPDSPLVSSLSLPYGFSMESTPLVSFYRTDLLFNQTELKAIHSSLPPSTPESVTGSFSSTSSARDNSIQSYLDTFLAPHPHNYRAMIVSTGDKWMSTDVPFFAAAMKEWTSLVSEALGEMRAGGGDEGREVLVRSYAAASESQGVEFDNEVDHVGVGWVQSMNEIFESVIHAQGDPHIRFLDIMGPASSPRGPHGPNSASPECLSTRDCTRGVVQGISTFLSHFLAELD